MFEVCESKSFKFIQKSLDDVDTPVWHLAFDAPGFMNVHYSKIHKLCKIIQKFCKVLNRPSLAWSFLCESTMPRAARRLRGGAWLFIAKKSHAGVAFFTKIGAWHFSLKRHACMADLIKKAMPSGGSSNVLFKKGRGFFC